MMHGGFYFLGFLFAGGLVFLAIVCGAIILVIRMVKGGLSPDQKEEKNEEARMIQEIYQGLSRMEQRVDALETILMEHGKKEV
ncbi:MAG: phage-shock protein [Desulfobacterium sp.]|jgi:phage shock protein B|nr:phage-shock protein [Desulfobacterium sp.]